MCVYLGVTDAYLFLWKTLEKGVGWIVSCQEQLSMSSRREATEEWQQERQHLNRIALEGSRGVRAEMSKVKADTQRKRKESNNP